MLLPKPLKQAALAALLLLTAVSLPARAQEFGPVVLHARVLARSDRPVAGVAVRLAATLDGLERDENGQTRALSFCTAGTAVTDARGVATLRVAGPQGRSDSGWFSGRVVIEAALGEANPALAALDPAPRQASLLLPDDQASTFAAAQTLEDLTLRVFDPPTKTVGGFPLWADTLGRADRIVVLLGGYDPFHVYDSGNLMRLIGTMGDALRASGVSLLVVTFPDSSPAPDAQVPTVVRAVRAAATASDHSVVLAGISEGGLVARWALVSAERAGTPLPVSTYLSLDVPNRGANMNPGLQAMVLRYGKACDRAALLCPAARAMMISRPANVTWKRLGLPGGARAVPVKWDNDGDDSQAFFARLHALNDRQGYPKNCRTVAVASGSRAGAGGGAQLLHLWLPWTYAWTLSACAEDRVPGSLLPSFFVSRFVTRMPLGVAGAYLRAVPTFIPTASALDAGPGEAPPFDVWYARPDDLPPLAHDQFGPDEGAFIIGQILRTDWRPYQP